jgi:hypothetical protein
MEIDRGVEYGEKEREECAVFNVVTPTPIVLHKLSFPLLTDMKRLSY